MLKPSNFHSECNIRHKSKSGRVGKLENRQQQQNRGVRGRQGRVEQNRTEQTSKESVVKKRSIFDSVEKDEWIDGV